MILQEIASLEAQLTQTAEASTEESKDASSPAAHADVLAQLQKAQERLHLLGPCPKPMMG
jgi:hypothetical protein